MSVNFEMPVVILAGGLGTRFREETEYRPKPMVKIGNQPILWHIMRTYAHYGFKHFIVCLGYKGEMVREYFLDYSAFTGDVLLDLGAKTQTHLRDTFEKIDWRVIMADTGAETMTGGRIKRIRDYVNTDRFMVTYGDGVADVNILALVEAHQRSGCVATLTGVRPTSRFGDLTIEANRVVHFAEKEFQPDTWINGGYFVFEKKIFDYLPGDACVLEQAPFRALAKESQLSIYKHDGFWQCMDTYREHEILNKLWDSGKAPWKVW